nr:MAG TPA: hypothetical protein [Bacteriophage sp.]
MRVGIPHISSTLFQSPTQKAFNFSSFKVNPQKVHFLFDN